MIPLAPIVMEFPYCTVFNIKYPPAVLTRNPRSPQGASPFPPFLAEWGFHSLCVGGLLVNVPELGFGRIGQVG